MAVVEHPAADFFQFRQKYLPANHEVFFVSYHQPAIRTPGPAHGQPTQAGGRTEFLFIKYPPFAVSTPFSFTKALRHVITNGKCGHRAVPAIHGLMELHCNTD